MPQPLIILTCMRSYSSLISGMLGQHPQMYGLPELNLFVTPKVFGMLTLFSAVRPNSLHGVLRAIAEVEFGHQDEQSVELAREWLNERSDWSTQALFQYFIDRLSPKICIEKSPSNVLKAAYVERMYSMFPNANYLHLVRHPRATCRSIHQIISKTDEITGRKRAEKVEPEKLWYESNHNTIKLMEHLPPGQGMTIQGEDLLTDPDLYLRQICQWLGIRDDADAIAAMKHPENSPYSCPGPENAQFGADPNFLSNPFYNKRDIPAVSLEGSLEWTEDEDSHFAEKTTRLARRLGYQ